jgi:hypothetical protein
MKTTKVIHEFLNEPELVRITDRIETTLFLLGIGQLTASIIFQELLAPGLISTLLFITLFFIRRPIQRTDEKEGEGGENQ